MQTFKLPIIVVLGSLFTFSSCTMFQKRSNQSGATNPVATTEQRPTVPTVQPAILNRYTSGWPDASVHAAKSLILKYGEPLESTPSMLVWVGIAPFKRIIVYRDEFSHNFPMLHKDVMEHVVAFKIPADKGTELTKFDGSVIFDRTRGELSARGNEEAMNFLALNLASDIITGKKDADSARMAFGKIAVEYLNGNKSVLTQNLQFVSPINTADADQSTKFKWAQSEEARPKKGLLKQAQEEELTE